jgi:LacI family transcriptional regulator
LATISDVAAYAGVGVGTVSRVLNDSPKVSEATRRRVVAAMEVLEYRPNPLARGLSRGRSHTVGVLVPFFTHASAVERLRGVVAALKDSAYDLVLFDVESPAHRDEHFAALTRRDRADGLLVVSLPPPARELARIVDAGVPVVLLDARGEDVPMVVTDDVEGGRIATRHLVDLGHERIAFIGEAPNNPFGFTSTALRERGYLAVLRAAGIRVDRHLIRYGAHDRTVAQRLAAGLLAKPERPTAVFAASDVQATGVLAAAAYAGLRVPEDLSVVGFDDIEIAAYAGLTTVHQPLFDSGRIATRMLLDHLDAGSHDDAVPGRDQGPWPGNNGSRDDHVRTLRELPLELVERTTTSAPPHRTARSRERRR